MLIMAYNFHPKRGDKQPAFLLFLESGVPVHARSRRLPTPKRRYTSSLRDPVTHNHRHVVRGAATREHISKMSIVKCRVSTGLGMNDETEKFLDVV